MEHEKYSNKKVFVFPSYVGIPFLIRNFDLSDKDNIFLTNNPSLYKWLSSLQLNVIKTPGFSSDLSRKALRDVGNLNLKISKLFIECKIYYFFYLSNIPMLHLIKCLSSENELVFINRDPKLKKIILWNVTPLAEFKKRLISKLAFRMILNISTDIYRVDEGFMFGKKYAKEFQYPTQEIPEVHEMNKALLRKDSTNNSVDILYIDNISVHYPKAALQVFGILQKLKESGRSIHIKPHPTFQPIDSLSVFPWIAREIPSEICMYSAKLVLGVSSTSLQEPIDKPVISLLKFLAVNDDFRERCLQQISSERIYYPESELAFHQLIKSLS